MSAPVDVLAVMDDARARLASLYGCAPLVASLTEASAAVAELVEASRDFRDCLSSHAYNAVPVARRVELIERYKPEQGTRPMRAAEARFNAALARFGGS